MLLAGGARVGRAVPVGGASGEGVAGVVGMNCPPGRADVPTFMRTNGAFEGFVVGCASFGTCVEPVCCAREFFLLNSLLEAPCLAARVVTNRPLLMKMRCYLVLRTHTHDSYRHAVYESLRSLTLLGCCWLG